MTILINLIFYCGMERIPS